MFEETSGNRLQLNDQDRRRVRYQRLARLAELIIRRLRRGRA